jgi:hypothetical protein
LAIASAKKRGQPSVLRNYTADDLNFIVAQAALDPAGYAPDVLVDVIGYLNFRTEILNGYVSKQFMNRDEAKTEYSKLLKKIRPKNAIPQNKQKGKKKHPAYLSAIVSMIAEKVLGHDGYDPDPRSLTIVSDKDILKAIFSRRFDGATPSTVNPKAIWEIKEYYGTTTFGSRVADGVYETLLDGYELSSVRNSFAFDIKHYLFVDDRFTWWECGRSYLCRIIDMLHTEHVDEVFFGKEVLSDWEKTLSKLK